MNKPEGVEALQSRPYVIAVGVDMQQTGEHALVEAMKLARARGDAVLHMIHVVSQSATFTRESERITWANEILEKVPPLLHQYVFDRSIEAGGLPSDAHLHVRLGKTAETLAQFCADYDVDMMIVGTHNRKGLERMILGSVADSLVHTAKCPVMVARPKNYEGIERTARPEPECQDCLRVRKASNGATPWCDFHARPHVQTHTYGYSSAASFTSGHDPGIIPG